MIQQSASARSASKRRIVLVHGAGHGAWCWERVVPVLEAQGFPVTAVDLPGLGADATPPSQVGFRSYVDRVCEAIRAQRGPVLLVGHSMGGGPVSQAAEETPDQVARLMYLAAMLPQSGEELGVMAKLAEEFPNAAGNPAVRPSAVPGALDFDPAWAAAAFYNQCDPQIAAEAVKRLRPQAIGPMQGTPITLTRERWGSIPKAYVVCTADHALSPDLQRWMCARAGNVKVVERPWDHSPFFSDPTRLAALIATEALEGA